MDEKDWKKLNIVFYDGACGMCNASVQQVIKYDQQGFFHFAPLQSSIGQEMLATIGKPYEGAYSIFVWIAAEQNIFIRGAAVKKIANKIPLNRLLLLLLDILPTIVLDGMYKIIAKNRHWIIPNKPACNLTYHSKYADRFIADEL